MIWLIGNKGMLGTELSKVFESNGVDYVGSDREVDILSASALREFSRGKKIEWIVNCAAYTAVDKAEDEEALAHALNAEGPREIAAVAALCGARMLHISTDYVFDGNGTRPYREDESVAPTGAYGRTKAEGEHRVLESSRDNIIVRTAWLYGQYGNNFVRTMLRLMNEKERIGVVADQRGTPTWAFDLANAILAIVTARSSPGGIYHFTNSGETTWYEFAREIYSQGRTRGLIGKECAIDALSSDQYPAKVKRPAYSVLSKEKIQKTFDITPPDWKASLGDYLLLLKG